MSDALARTEDNPGRSTGTSGQVATPSRGQWVQSALSVAGFVGVHIGALFVFAVGFSWSGLALFCGTYALRCWAIASGFHRYFAHGAYQTSRVLQFVIGWIGTSAMQLGVLSWVSTHRRHHRHADNERDPHSPHQRSFLYSHCGWVFDPRLERLEPSLLSDLQRYRELVWLERYKHIPPASLALGLWLLAGNTGLVWGFFLPTAILWHASLATGSFAHKAGGYRNFDTADDSRNSRLISVALLGGGWHNNHHRAPTSARHGIGWREPDPQFVSIQLLERLGLVWNVRDTMPAPELSAV